MARAAAGGNQHEESLDSGSHADSNHGHAWALRGLQHALMHTHTHSLLPHAASRARATLVFGSLAALNFVLCLLAVVSYLEAPPGATTRLQIYGKAAAAVICGGLVYDNAILAAGQFIGIGKAVRPASQALTFSRDARASTHLSPLPRTAARSVRCAAGPALEYISWGRFYLHALTPLGCFTVLDLAVRTGVFWAADWVVSVLYVVTLLLFVFSFHHMFLSGLTIEPAELQGLVMYTSIHNRSRPSDLLAMLLPAIFLSLLAVSAEGEGGVLCVVQVLLCVLEPG